MMSNSDVKQVEFEGEEAGAGFAPPGLDLFASAFLLVLSGVVIVASVALPVPGNWTTAPGLLPLLTAGSLAVMAILLGVSAWTRHKAGVVAHPGEARVGANDKRVMLLAGTIAVYIAALQFLAFQAYFSVAGVPYVLSAFEPVTFIALAAIIHVSWRGPLWITVVISAIWTLTLSLVFQKIFSIPLPGGF